MEMRCLKSEQVCAALRWKGSSILVECRALPRADPWELFIMFKLLLTPTDGSVLGRGLVL